jgi:hypothetical protein
MGYSKWKKSLWRTGGCVLGGLLLTAGIAGAQSVLVMTSTNNASGNAVEVFRLNTGGTPSLPLVNTLNTGGNGGASGNSGMVQFSGNFGAVANFGSNNVTQLIRYADHVALGRTIEMAKGCTQPDSVALKGEQLFVVGANCAETHAWPWGFVDGNVVKLSDASAAQIAVGETWAAVTMKSGTVVQMPLRHDGTLNGASNTVTLPSNANNTPLGEAFWGDTLGFTPAHSPDSFALLSDSGVVSPIAGPTPAFPANAPCWVAKGPRSVWYTGNSPGQAIAIFFTDEQGGVFYKNVALPGMPDDITVSEDKKWLAVIYSAGGSGFVAVYAIDEYGDLTWVATSSGVAATTFSGVAISE